MKRILLTALTILVSLPMLAQLNVQMHYDFADALYGNELSNRAHWTATVENFKADKWGSTYFFVDGNFADNSMESAYAEFSRELRFWKAPIAIHVEYNGGLSGGGSYNDAYLAALESVSDDFKLSLGTELELTKNLVWPTDGLNDRFYAIPTLAAKWTF